MRSPKYLPTSLLSLALLCAGTNFAMSDCSAPIEQGGIIISVDDTDVPIAISSAAHAVSPDGSDMLEVTLCPESARQLAELTAANVGRNMSLERDGIALAGTMISEPILNGMFQMSGPMSEEEMKVLAEELVEPAE